MEELQQINTVSLIITPIGRRYMTGFESSAGYLFSNGSESVFLVDGRYYEAACKKVQGARVQLIESARLQLLKTAEELGAERITVETDITIAQLNALKDIFGTIPVEPCEKLTKSIQALRMQKSELEVENIVKAQRIAERAFETVLNYVKEGVSERKLAVELDYTLRRFGAEKIAFDTIVVSGENSSMPHGVPGYRSIKNGDFITFDFGAMYNGYCSDMTRTVAVGYATDEMELVYNSVLQANQAAIAKVAANVKCCEVDAAARDVIRGAGFGKYFTHSTGHGVGLEVHEQPTLAPKNEECLPVGSIVTIEPGIYIPEKFGVRIEDMVLVQSDGCKNLTEFEKKLLIL